MVVTRLYFEIPDNGGSTTTHTIDLARELSKHHRRLVRQKQIFTVYGGMYQDSGESGVPSNAYFSTAPHYWVTKRAINRGFKAWRKQLSDAMTNQAEIDSGNPLRTGKYSDFKVHLDSGSVGNYLVAKDASGTDLPEGEWDYSTLTMPRPDMAAGTSPETWVQLDSDQFDLKIVGGHSATGSGPTQNYSRVGLLDSWIDSRPLLNSNTDSPDNNPETANDPLTLMFYTGDSDEDQKIVDAINDENDVPPYDIDKLYGSAGHGTTGADLQMQCLVSPDSGSGIASVAGFQALCGLIRIQVTGDTGSNGAALILDVESNGVGF